MPNVQARGGLDGKLTISYLGIFKSMTIHWSPLDRTISTLFINSLGC